MRWLLVKDFQILRRSPLLVALLVAYPIALALMIGFALSSPPGKPKVAFLTQVPPGQGRIHFGSQEINISSYAKDLFASIQPIIVHSQAEAMADVRSGRALAAVIVPADIPQQIQSLVTTGVGSPTVQVILNSNDPLERQFADQAIKARLNDVQQAVSKQVLHVAVADLQQVLNGGTIQFLGQNFRLLGLRNSRALVQRAIAELPASSPLRSSLGQVVGFADLAIQGLGFASPVLGSIGTPLAVQQTELAGKTTPAATYAATISVIFSLMLVTMLLAAGMLALEREEHAFARLVRGLVSPSALLAEKVVLAGGCATLAALVMSAGISSFVSLAWSRFPLWVVALAAAGIAFGALGVAIGGLAREVRAASLLAFMLSLPIAFIALVPTAAVSGTLKSALDTVAFIFPFKPALDATNNAFSGTAPGIGWPLLHLIGLAVAFGILARAAVRRLA
ncbi:MAG TPA: ABC transporter permease [Solirubrobacteraceae bacterium]|nr:ABC transporter permease [Solirubrobacteraceae bacterium]